MPPRKKKSHKKRNPKVNINTEYENTDGRSKFLFNIAKDVKLLKTSLQHNPWQLGREKWILVAQELSIEFGCTISARTLRDLVNLLLKKYESEQLTSKTGTEEEVTERGSLLDEVAACVAEAQQQIVIEIGAEDSAEGIQEENDIANSENGRQNSKALNEKTEKILADKERDDLTNLSSFAPEPSPIRRKRSGMSFEEKLVEKKHEQEMELESKRLLIEEDKVRNNYLLERERWELEKMRFELETSKEERAAEESRRKDEITRAQLEIQSNMYQLMMAFSKKE